MLAIKTFSAQAQEAAAAAASLASSATDAASSAVSSATDAASSAVSSATDAASSAMSSATDAATSTVSSATDAATSAASAATNAATSAASTAANAAASAATVASDAASTATSAATDAASSAVNAASKVTDATTNMAASLANHTAMEKDESPEPVERPAENIEMETLKVKKEEDFRQSKENIEIISDEEKFMTAIENGDIGVYMDMLYRKEELGLDINKMRDSNGLSPLRLAVSLGYAGTVDQLLKHGAHVGDAMLRAVDVGFYETVKVIHDHANKCKNGITRRRILDCQCEDDDYHPDVTPIVLAAQQNDFAIVKLLTDAGIRILSVTHKKGRRQLKRTVSRQTKATDDLQKSIGTLEVFRGLASEAYLIQGNEDPIEAAFALSKKLSDLGQKDVEFRLSYADLAESVDQVVPELISHARNTEEILSILTFSDTSGGSGKDTPKNLGPFPKITKAIDYEQKSFVAHPNCQQAVLAKFYGKQAFLRDQNTTYKFLYMLLLIIGFPFLSLTYLYLPVQRVKEFLNCPYSTFSMRMASDLVFVVLLTVDTIFNHSHLNSHMSLEYATKILLLVWILGIAWRNVKILKKHGVSALLDSTQWRDYLLVSLFLLGAFLEWVSYILYLENLDTDVTSEVRRSADMQFYQMNSVNHYNQNLTFDLPDVGYHPMTVLHRVARASRSRVNSGGTDQTSSGTTVFADEETRIFVELSWWHPELIATTFYAMSTVISFLRMLDYIIISDVLGPFKISLGTMIAKTANFFVVAGIVLLSFAVGLTSLYGYYTKIDSLTCGGSDGEPCKKDNFSNLFYSAVYLFWSIMGVEDNSPLYLEDQAVTIEDAGLILYALFYILMILVLLNALIAVMSEAYNSVEENSDLEWKFHSTAMWMSILLDDDVVPPPFNLLPSVESIKKMLTSDSKRASSKKKDKEEELRRHETSKAQYKRVIGKLVERFVTAKSNGETSGTAEVTLTDIRNLKNELQGLKLEIFQRLFETNHSIQKTTDEGMTLCDTSKQAKQVLNQAGKIHNEVKEIFLKSVDDFETRVSSHQKLIKKEREKWDEIEYLESLPPLPESPPPGLFSQIVFSMGPKKDASKDENKDKELGLGKKEYIVTKTVGTQCSLQDFDERPVIRKIPLFGKLFEAKETAVTKKSPEKMTKSDSLTPNGNGVNPIMPLLVTGETPVAKDKEFPTKMSNSDLTDNDTNIEISENYSSTESLIKKDDISSTVGDFAEDEALSTHNPFQLAQVNKPGLSASNSSGVNTSSLDDFSEPDVPIVDDNLSQSINSEEQDTNEPGFLTKLIGKLLSNAAPGATYGATLAQVSDTYTRFEEAGAASRSNDDEVQKHAAIKANGNVKAEPVKTYLIDNMVVQTSTVNVEDEEAANSYSENDTKDTRSLQEESNGSGDITQVQNDPDSDIPIIATTNLDVNSTGPNNGILEKEDGDSDSQMSASSNDEILSADKTINNSTEKVVMIEISESNILEGDESWDSISVNSVAI